MTRRSERESAVNGQSCNRRRTYVINPTFQWKYVITIAVLVFLISMVISSILYGVLHYQARLRLMHPESYAASVMPVVFAFGAVFSLVTAGGAGLWAIVVTHRICGPLFVVERYVAQLGDGFIPEPRALRRKDEFKGFYATFARAMESMRERRREESDALVKALATARSALDADDYVRKQALESIAAHLETLHDAVEKSVGGAAGDGDAVPSAKSDLAGTPPVAVA